MNQTVSQIASQAPFYQNWTFWAFVVAAIALIASQLPRLWTVLRRPKLKLELFSRIVIWHDIGNPSIQAQFLIDNLGGRTARVTAINASISKDKTLLVDFPARGYFQNPSDKQVVLFTGFNVPPRSEWSHIVNFFDFRSRLDENALRAAKSKLKADIFEKRKIKRVPSENLVEAAPALVKPFLETFLKKFIWHPGEYEMRISIEAVPEYASICRTYRFVIFESDTETMKGVTDDYKFGDGIYWVSGKHEMTFAEIRE
jgi:hypothetical protein